MLVCKASARAVLRTLQEIGFAAEMDGEYIRADPPEGFAYRLQPAIRNEDRQRLPPLQFVIWYDGRLERLDAGEQLLKFRIVLSNIKGNKALGLTEEKDHQWLSHEVNDAGFFGRLNTHNIWYCVQWECFLDQPPTASFLLAAMRELASSYDTALFHVLQRAKRLTRRRLKEQ